MEADRVSHSKAKTHLTDLKQDVDNLEYTFSENEMSPVIIHTLPDPHCMGAQQELDVSVSV